MNTELKTQLNSGDDRRVFLGLDRPPLISAVQWLIEFDCSSRESNSDLRALDLRDRLIVVPTSRAKQRILQLLVQLATEQGLSLTPPEIVTVGNLPEKLYTAEKLLATDLAQQIAWSRALEASTVDELKSLTGRTEVESLRDWQPLAALLSKLHQRLANDIWSFRSVAREIDSIQGFLAEEKARWEALREIQNRYYALLTEADLWDRQAARSVAARSADRGNPMCRTSKAVILVGVADLNRSTTEMLKQVRNQVYVLVAAPQAMADRFDPFGSIITDKWLETDIVIDDSQIKIVDQPDDQAEAVARYLGQQGAQYVADQMTVGVPDPAVIPQIERSLNSIGAPHRSLAGRSLSETSPVRLMIACREYLRAQDYESLAALVRHPDLFQWIEERVGGNTWLALLDEFQNRNLPAQIRLGQKMAFGDPKQIADGFPNGDKDGVRHAARRAVAAEMLNRIHGFISGLLLPLIGDERPLAEWTVTWTNVLVEVYGDRVLDKRNPQDQQILRACDVLYGSLAGQKQVPENFATTTGSIQALDWALEAAAENRVVPPAEPDAVELAGWLDLALDDAPVMCVTGMNDEHVPTSEVGHQFLPNGLCEQLKILDNNRRYARDAYALTVITSVRENLLLISGRRDEKGEPKKPSRLLFATDDESAARRARAFFTYEGKPRPGFWLTQMTDEEKKERPTQQFPIPIPHCEIGPQKLSVTRFKEFLKCPYRFYLSKVLNLETVSDDLKEMDGGAFGSLAHDVLESFADSSTRDSSDSDTICDFLNKRLDEVAAVQFSKSQLPAVRIQVEQLRQRLKRFAEIQADHRRAGWRIVHAEDLHEHELIVDGEPYIIRGKIDRVDQHEVTGQVAVWDYKTSDAGKTPDKVHYSRKHGWKDLQLPLYRHLIKEVKEVEGADFSNMIVGYILLPKQLGKIEFAEFEMNGEMVLSADAMAYDVIREVRKAEFWPPTRKPPEFSADLAAICQDFVAEQWTAEPGSGPARAALPW